MFAVHHALSDFVYNRQIMRSFVNNLCSIQLGKSPSIDIVYPPSDPIETVVDNIEIKSVGTEIKTCSSEKTVMAIDALYRSNSKQANLIWTENSSRTLRMKLDAELSKAFEASRSLCKGSLNATILTVCLKSFMRMLGSSDISYVCKSNSLLRVFFFRRFQIKLTGIFLYFPHWFATLNDFS
jgi:hypothetical protein